MSVRPMAVVVAIVVVVSMAAHGQGPAPNSQSAPTGSALIIGRVVDGTTGAAVTSAVVTIGGPNAPRTGAMVLVDSQGRFIFSGLAGGTFTLVAQKNGYLNGAYGRTRPGGQTQSIVLPDGGRVTDAAIRLWRTASIDGHVVDEAGEPVSGVRVMALQRTWVAGHPSLSTNGGGGASDDVGRYRIGGLTPGEYVIASDARLITYPIAFVEAASAAIQAGEAARQARSAELAGGLSMMGGNPTAASRRLGEFVVVPGPGAPVPLGNDRLSIFPITFHPSALTADVASPIRLAAGEQRTGVDLHLKLTPTVKIAGTATGPNGPIANLGLRLQLGAGSQFFSRMLVEPAQTVTDAHGGFTFLGVPPGAYNIVGAMSSPQGDVSAALAVTTGDKDLADVALVLRQSPRVNARVVFEGTSDKPQLRALVALLVIDQADGHFQRQPFQVDSDGNLSARSVLPGTYFIHFDLRAPQGAAGQMGPWTLKSAIVNGRDVSDAPLIVDATDVNDLVITMTDHPAALAGTVRTTQGAADATAAVLVFPADKTMWSDYGASPRRLRSVRPDRTGAFSVPALPAGDYFLIAVPDDLAGDWQRQTFLERAAPMATRVKVEDGKSAAVDLVTKRW